MLPSRYVGDIGMIQGKFLNIQKERKEEGLVKDWPTIFANCTIVFAN